MEQFHLPFKHPAGGVHDHELCEHAHPSNWRNPEPRGTYPLVVIGGGPAGLLAARQAARNGIKVALVERDLLGGNSLNFSSLPSKALIRTSRLYADLRNALHYGVCPQEHIEVDFALVMERLRRIRARISRLDSAERLSGEGIDVFMGAAVFTSSHTLEVAGTALRFRKALIATGSRSMLPAIPGLAEAGYHTNETVFDLKALPPSLLVIGGGPVGCELAQALARLGARVIIAHNQPLFLPKEERDAAQMVADALARDGVEIHLNTNVTKVWVEGDKKCVQTWNDGNVATLRVDDILTGIGRVPAVLGLGLDAAGIDYSVQDGIRVDDFLRTSQHHIYAAGDVCMEHQFVDTAMASARTAVHNALFFGRRRMSKLIIPWCTYTDPEIAHVGLYVRQARERGIPIITYTVPMHDVDRAITDGEEDGFVKLHIRDGSDTILGATVVARHAGEMINGITLAMVAGIGLKTVARVIHTYPTQADAIHMAARAHHGSGIHPWLARLLRPWLNR